MNKKFLSAILFGALMVSSTGTFVSCKAYDDDIDQINQKLDGVEAVSYTHLYFCNFSLFQSLPGSWAIDQIFPIMPIQRLDEKPDRNATLQDRCV